VGSTLRLAADASNWFVSVVGVEVSVTPAVVVAAIVELDDSLLDDEPDSPEHAATNRPAAAMAARHFLMWIPFPIDGQ
jgi:hypothetical protein